MRDPVSTPQSGSGGTAPATGAAPAPGEVFQASAQGADRGAPLAIALLSGGLDSATAAALAIEAGWRVIGLSFDYGQRHRRELEAAAAVARHLALDDHRRLRVDLAAWGGSSLTDASLSLPADGVQPEVIPSTYVPGRNTVFIALALSLAEAVGADRLVLGVNAVDYSGYPDCRPDYLEAFQRLADLATRAGREGRGPRLWAPLVAWDKPRIVREALRLGVPLEITWSCYAGGAQPCGVCDSCRIRDQALLAVGRADLAGLHRDPAAVAASGLPGTQAAPQAAPPQATAPQAVRGSAGAPQGQPPGSVAAADPPLQAPPVPGDGPPGDSPAVDPPRVSPQATAAQGTAPQRTAPQSTAHWRMALQGAAPQVVVGSAGPPQGQTPEPGAPDSRPGAGPAGVPEAGRTP